MQLTCFLLTTLLDVCQYEWVTQYIPLHKHIMVINKYLTLTETSCTDINCAVSEMRRVQVKPCSCAIVFFRYAVIYAEERTQFNNSEQEKSEFVSSMKVVMAIKFSQIYISNFTCVFLYKY